MNRVVDRFRGILFGEVGVRRWHFNCKFSTCNWTLAWGADLGCCQDSTFLTSCIVLMVFDEIFFYDCEAFLASVVHYVTGG